MVAMLLRNHSSASVLLLAQHSLPDAIESPTFQLVLEDGAGLSSVSTFRSTFRSSSIRLGIIAAGRRNIGFIQPPILQFSFVIQA